MVLFDVDGFCAFVLHYSNNPRFAFASGCRNCAVEISRKTLFASETLQIGLVETRPRSDACGDVERQDRNAVVLPLSGVFSKHDAPGRHIIATPSHAVLVAANTPYRIGFPGGIGDRALALRFGEDLAPDQFHRHGGAAPLASNGLLPAGAMVLRNLLGARLERAPADDFEIETIGLDLLHLSLKSMRKEALPLRQTAHARRARALERVKEAVAMAPSDKWSIAKLAKVANLSPFHLCHVFRQMVGTSIYDYVLHERLAHSLDAVLDRGSDLTAIALDAGFSSHSHFTARFRAFFGCTPAALRRAATAARVCELRKIVTARPH
jgi:AraC family transcriptional regulator